MPRRWGVALAVLFLAVVIGYAITNVQNKGEERLYQTQIEACQRGNELRRESNERAAYHQADLNALRSFLEGAKTAREAAYERGKAKEDKEAAESYAEDLRSLQGISFDGIKEVDCHKVVRKP